MLKRAVTIMLSAAFLATATSAVMIVPSDQAVAATKPKEQSGMSYRDRQKTCSAEWKAAKAAKTTKGMKWPKFWSDCNKRLKAAKSA